MLRGKRLGTLCVVRRERLVYLLVLSCRRLGSRIVFNGKPAESAHLAVQIFQYFEQCSAAAVFVNKLVKFAVRIAHSVGRVALPAFAEVVKKLKKEK